MASLTFFLPSLSVTRCLTPFHKRRRFSRHSLISSRWSTRWIPPTRHSGLRAVLGDYGDKYAERDPEEEIKKALGLFDEDHTGKITLKNMKRWRELGENLERGGAAVMIDEFDRDQTVRLAATSSTSCASPPCA